MSNDIIKSGTRGLQVSSPQVVKGSSFLRSLPKKLSRVTSGGKIIREIDGMRFLAILLVVVQHLSERFVRNTPIVFREGKELDIAGFITSHGFIGVHIFFAISGFILGLPFASYYLYGGREISLKSYFWRRITRLEPPYILSLLLIAGLWFVTGKTLAELGPHLLASLLYVHNLIYGSWSTINPPVWSLEVEVQFYILAPFLSLFFFRISNKVMRRAAFLTFIFAWMLLQQYVGFYPTGFTLFSLFAHVHLFLVGFMLVDIYLVDWKDGIKRHAVFNYTAIAALTTAIYFWSWDHHLINRIVFAVSVFVLLYSIFRSTWVNRFFTFPWITAIGGMCYSIYLIHMPILEVYVRFSKYIVVTNIFTVNYLIQFMLMVPLLLTASIIFYLLIEKPCMHKDWPEKLVAWVKK